MRNKLTDLNNHLFAQLERLCDEELHGEDLRVEIVRSAAVARIAKEIVSNGVLVLTVQKAMAEGFLDERQVPAMLGRNENASIYR